MKEATIQISLPLTRGAVPAATGTRDSLEGIKWSYSRRTLLEQCPRRYYYEHYGVKASARRGHPDKPVLGLLKSLENRHERAGTIAHLAIGAYLRKAQSGEVWLADRLCKWAQDIFRKDCAYSQADPDGTSRPSGRFPPVLLHEYYYRHPAASALCAETERRLVKAVQTFATDGRLVEFRQAGALPGSLVEHRLTLQGLPCHVQGKLDLAVPMRGGGAVVDWKLGDSASGGDDSLQLGVYALWAARHFTCSPEKVQVCKIYLTTGDVSHFSTTGGVLARCRARIVQDAERMAAVHHYGQRGVIEAFTPCAQPGVCALCSFQQVCPEGRAVLHA